MLFRSNVLRAVAALSLVVLLGAVAFADTIRLKDGSIIKGKIISFTGGKFTVATGGGTRKRQMTFTPGEIESIDFETPPIQDTFVSASNRTVPEPRPVQKKPAVIIEDRKPPVVIEDKSPPVAADIVEEETTDEVDPPATVPATVPRKISTAKPVALAVKVTADNTANGWTNSGWVVKKGQRIRISGTGEVSIGGGKKTGPSGLYDLEDNQKLLKSVPTGALIAVIGDDNNEFIYIGKEREFTATRDGALFLGLNEGNLNDNTGTFDVSVEISPDGGE